MLLTLVRNEFTQNATLGTLLSFNDSRSLYLCETLEDVDRNLELTGAEAKVPKHTAIPRGRYKLAWTYSNRFKRYMLELLEVPYFSGIRIHSGNDHFDTDGCILVGKARLNGRITTSAQTLKYVQAYVRPFLAIGPTYIEIV